MVLFGYGLVLFDSASFGVSIIQICYHAKSGACSLKSDRVMPNLVKFGLACFGLVLTFYQGSMTAP